MKKKYLLLIIISLLVSCGNDKYAIPAQDWETLNVQDSSMQSVKSKPGWKKILSPLYSKVPYKQIRDFQYILLI